MLGKTTTKLSDKRECLDKSKQNDKALDEIKTRVDDLEQKVAANKEAIENPDIVKVSGTFGNVTSDVIDSSRVNSDIVNANELHTDVIASTSNELNINAETTSFNNVKAKNIDAVNLNVQNATLPGTMNFDNILTKNLDSDVIDAAVIDTDDLRVLNKVPDLKVGNLTADDAHTSNLTADEATFTKTLLAVGAHIDDLAANIANAQTGNIKNFSSNKSLIDEATIKTLYAPGFKGAKTLTLDTTLPISDIITFKMPVLSGYFIIRNDDFSITVFVNNSEVKTGLYKPAIFYQLTQAAVGVIAEVRYCAEDNNIYIYYKRQDELIKSVDYIVVTPNTELPSELTYDINNYAPVAAFKTYPDAYNHIAFMNRPEDMALLVQGRFKASAQEIGQDELFLKSIFLKDRLAFANTVTGGYDSVIMGGYDANNNKPLLKVTNGTGLEVEGDSTFAKNLTVNGTTYLNGNIIQNGDTYETHAQQVYTKDAMIITRDGATLPLNENELTGIKATHYDEEGNDGVLAFDKTGTARVGDVGKEQPIATRSEIEDMEDTSIVSWNAAEQKLITSRNPTIFGSRIAKTEDTFMLTGAEGMDNIPQDYTTLDQVVIAGQYAIRNDSEKYIGKPAGETGPYDLTVGYFNADKSKPYQVYFGKASNNLYYRQSNGDEVEGSFTLWEKVANSTDLKNIINGTVKKAKGLSFNPATLSRTDVSYHQISIKVGIFSPAALAVAGSKGAYSLITFTTGNKGVVEGTRIEGNSLQKILGAKIDYVSEIVNIYLKMDKYNISKVINLASDADCEIKEISKETYDAVNTEVPITYLATKDQPAYEYKDIYRTKYDDSHYDNVEEMITYLTTTGGFATGSVIIVDGGPSNEPNSWFTYTWLPHRNGKPWGDNKDYGTLTLNLMSSNSYIVATGGGKWEYYYENRSIYGPFQLATTDGTVQKAKSPYFKPITSDLYDFSKITENGWYEYKWNDSPKYTNVPDKLLGGKSVGYLLLFNNGYNRQYTLTIGGLVFLGYLDGESTKITWFEVTRKNSTLVYDIAGAGDYRPPKNLDDAPEGASIYEFTYYEDCINKPWFDTYFGGTVLTFKDYHNDINSYTQIYISQKTSPEGGNLIGFRRRELNGAWTAWDQIVTGDMIPYKPLNLQWKDIGLTNNVAATVKDFCLGFYKKGYKTGDILHFIYWYQGTGKIIGAGNETGYLASGTVNILNAWKDDGGTYWFIIQIIDDIGNAYIGKWSGKENEEGTTHLRKLS